MSELITQELFTDGQTNINAANMNGIVGRATVQPDVIINKPASVTMDVADQFLVLKTDNTLARSRFDTIVNSVASTLPLANTTQNGMLRQVSGLATDFVDGTNNCQQLLKGFVSKTAAYTLTVSDSGKYIICSGGSWVLTLPAPANGLAFQVRNDMGISGTTGTITLQPTGGTIDGLATKPILPQQECTVVTDGTNWRTFGLKREVILGTQDITSPTANGTILLPVGYRYFELEFESLKSVVDNQGLVALFSVDGGIIWGPVYNYQVNLNNSATVITTVAGVSAANANLGVTANSTNPIAQCHVRINPGGVPQYASLAGAWIQTSTYNRSATAFGWASGLTGPINALRYFFASGSIANSSLTVKGVV